MRSCFARTVTAYPQPRTQPERHYIPVRRDLSNLDDALDRLHDMDYLEELTSRAYEEVYLQGAWTIREFGDQLREAFGTSRRPSGGRRVRSTLRAREAHD